MTGKRKRTPRPTITVYVTIGNTDNKLTCQEWSEFYATTDLLLKGCCTTVHGCWHSLPAVPYVNACWGIEVPTDEVSTLKTELRQLAANYRQDSIAWAPTVACMLEPMDAS